MSDTQELKALPLQHFHAHHGARFVPFVGWNMPVQYSGIIQEHLAVRHAAGIFDVSHMGEIYVEGPQAESFLQYVCCNDVYKLYDGKAQYSALLNAHGGVIDDIIIYRFSADRFLLCVNASNVEKDFSWLQNQTLRYESVVLRNESADYAQIALQGPRAMEIVDLVFRTPYSSNLKRFHFAQASFSGADVIIARTGYTGEDGVEIFISRTKGAFESAEVLAQACFEAGKEFGCLLCGLGSRDSLRLEAALPLHGHELVENISALESGLGWIIPFEKEGDFIGKAALEEQQRNGLQRQLIGLEVLEPGIVRGDDSIVSATGEQIGQVTSGTKTPSLERPICLAFVNVAALETPEKLFALVRGRKILVERTPLPFYRRKK